MPICVPVRDMKSTSTFVDLVERESEVTVTKNGREAMHCMSDERYQALCQEAAKARLLSHMLVAKREEEAGDYVPYDTFAEAMRDKYVLS
ncbi:MAG: type II toxin-antitoxin system Phd/YefM family antitoxin [Subdoligranulum variabile]|nr:MAG: type II toxin-antitoxin system Phd/YefM family antitoxin [Subdoligranulum variabile]